MVLIEPVLVQIRRLQPRLSARFWLVLCLTAMVWMSLGVRLPAIALPLGGGVPELASVFHFSGSRPGILGVKDGRLAACPATPNCVSSQVNGSVDPVHGIAPLAIAASPEETFARLRSAVESQAEVIEASSEYLYAEYTSGLFGFVDDVEFWLNRDRHQIEVRSASRLGESDLGVNRTRIEALRAVLAGAV